MRNKKTNSTSKKKVNIYFCPNCKNTDVRYVFTIQNLFGLVPKMYCNKCKHSSNNFPMLTVKKSKLNNEVLNG